MTYGKWLAAFAAVGSVACAPDQSDEAQDAEESSETAAVEPAQAAAAVASPNIMGTLPPGEYRLDPSHSIISFDVSHLGFSRFVGGFDEFEAVMQIDPAAPEGAQLNVTVQVASLDIPSPPPGFVEELLGSDWLNAEAHPTMTFRSSEVSMTGDYSATLVGDLALNGVTAPVSLDVTFNGGWEGIPPAPFALLGFSATGQLQRSQFGVDAGIPEPGSSMGVGDTVNLRIEAEFNGPEWTPPAEQSR